MPEVHVDDEAVLWSASAADREGRPLLLLLHGYNSNEGDLFGLAPYLPLEPAIASLRAPLYTGYGHAWFPLLVDGVPELSVEAADAATDAILAWLDRAAPDAGPIGLLGFSQGGGDGPRTAAPRPRPVRVRGEPRRVRAARANATATSGCRSSRRTCSGAAALPTA